MNEETIDPSQWLHQSVHKAYPEMMKRLGAMVNENGRITCATRFGFDMLYRYPENEPIFNATHLSAAEFITTLRSVAFERTNHTRLKYMIVEYMHGATISIDGYCPMTLYVMIMKQLKPQPRAMIERICWKELRSNDIGWLMLCVADIRGNFEELSKIIENSLDIMKQRLENGEMKRGEVSLKSTEPV